MTISFAFVFFSVRKISTHLEQLKPSFAQPPPVHALHRGRRFGHLRDSPPLRFESPLPPAPQALQQRGGVGQAVLQAPALR